jgi:hypothetical protein
VVQGEDERSGIARDERLDGRRAVHGTVRVLGGLPPEREYVRDVA